MPTKHNMVVYRFWHNRSARGLVGYVGKYSQYPRRINLSSRKKDKGCLKLYEALNKYPISIWKVEILASGFKSIAALNKAERYFIRKFDSRNKGYNITKGGEGGPGWQKGRSLSAETRKKLSDANKGKNHPKWGKKDSLNTRKKKSKSSKGNKANLGKKFSPEHKSGIGKAQKATWDSYSTAQKKRRCQAMKLGWARRRARLRKENERRAESTNS